MDTITDRKEPITDDTRFTLTPEGLAAVDAPRTCPRCGDALAVANFYQGGAGYLPWEFCQRPACDYWKRAA